MIINIKLGRSQPSVLLPSFRLSHQLDHHHAQFTRLGRAVVVAGLTAMTDFHLGSVKSTSAAVTVWTRWLPGELVREAVECVENGGGRFGRHHFPTAWTEFPPVILLA